MTTAERFWAKVNKDGPVMRPELGPCWLWMARRLPAGYGHFGIGSKKDKSTRLVLAHRMAFFLEHGRWPDPCGLHHCDNPPCCRTDHIFEGTKKDNARDRVAKGRQGDTRGDRNGARLHPESLSRGESHREIMRDVRARGERHGCAKLTQTIVDDIRRWHSRRQGARLAREHGVSKSTVSLILKNKIWRTAT